MFLQYQFRYRSIIIFLLTLLSLKEGYAQRIVAYVPSYSYSAINTTHWDCVTDALYAFAVVDNQGNVVIDNLSLFNSVRSKCQPMDPNGPKLWLSVGGYGQSFSFYSASSNDTYRANMCTQLATFCTMYNLAGIDIDWEFPTPVQAPTHELLMASIKAALPQGKKLSIAVGGEYDPAIATPTHLDYYTSGSLAYCDYINVMTYDFPFAYGPDHSSLAHSQASVLAWNQKGGGNIMHKLTIGVPFYGRANGPVIEYSSLSNTDMTTVMNTGMLVSGGDTYYFNSTATLQAKTQWITDQGGSGVMFWQAGQDGSGIYSMQQVICDAMVIACSTPQPHLGSDTLICSTNSYVIGDVTLSAASGRTFSWTKDGNTLSETDATLTISSPGLYELSVTEGTCTRSDEIIVHSFSPTAGGTSTVPCNPGTAILTANGSGTFEWYDTAVKGKLIGIGKTVTTPVLHADTDFYLQYSVGADSAHAGKLSYTTPTAYKPADNNGKPYYTHKVTINQTVTIASVKLSQYATTSDVRIMVYDNTGHLVKQSTSSTPYTSVYPLSTFYINFTLDPGVYFIGAYIPGAIPSAGYPTVNTDVTAGQAQGYSALNGIFSMEANCYELDFLDVNSQTGFYGQIFDWKISTPTTNPCPRIPVPVVMSTAVVSDPGPITGDNYICKGSTFTFSVDPVADATSYIWEYSGTGAVTTAHTPSITITFSSTATAGTLSVKTTNGCDTSSVSTLPIMLRYTSIPGAVDAPVNIIGKTAVCVNTPDVFSVPPVPGITSYLWEYNGIGTATISGNTNPVNISFSTPMRAIAGTLSVKAIKGCDTSEATTTIISYIDDQIPATPTSISGSNYPSNTVETYTQYFFEVDPVYVFYNNAHSFTWTYSGTGATMWNTNYSQQSLIFYPPATPGTLSVTADNACGSSPPCSIQIATVVTDVDESAYHSLKAYVEPNPFEYDGQLFISLIEGMNVNATLYDLAGSEKIVLLNNESLTQGEHYYPLPAELPSGVYIIKIQANNQVNTIRLVKLK